MDLGWSLGDCSLAYIIGLSMVYRLYRLDNAVAGLGYMTYNNHIFESHMQSKHSSVVLVFKT